MIEMNNDLRLKTVLRHRFLDIKFTNIENIDSNTYKLTDKTGEMFVRFIGNRVQVSFVEDFTFIFEEFPFSDLEA